MLTRGPGAAGGLLARDAQAARARPDASTPDRAPARKGQPSRLPEVLGYLGGTFVVAAALLVVGWSWESFSHATRVLLTALSALVVFGAGLAIGLAASGGRATLGRPDQDVRRRLVGVLLVLGSFLAAGAVALLGENRSGDIRILPVALTALVLTAVAVWLAPGAAPTLGLFAATAMAAASPLNLSSEPAALTWTLIFLTLGLLWVAVGPLVTRTPSAALAVGLGTLVVTGWVASEQSDRGLRRRRRGLDRVGRRRRGAPGHRHPRGSHRPRRGLLPARTAVAVAGGCDRVGGRPRLPRRR